MAQSGRGRARFTCFLLSLSEDILSFRWTLVLRPSSSNSVHQRRTESLYIHHFLQRDRRERPSTSVVRGRCIGQVVCRAILTDLVRRKLRRKPRNSAFANTVTSNDWQRSRDNLNGSGLDAGMQ